MAYQYVLGTLPAARSERTIVRFLLMFNVWRTRARTRRQLLNVEDRLLEDMGLTRLEAERESRKHFWQA